MSSSSQESSTLSGIPLTWWCLWAQSRLLHQPACGLDNVMDEMRQEISLSLHFRPILILPMQAVSSLEEQFEHKQDTSTEHT